LSHNHAQGNGAFCQERSTVTIHRSLTPLPNVISLVMTLLVYNGQNSADEVKQTEMTQSSVFFLIGTGLGLRTMITLRCERHLNRYPVPEWVPQQVYLHPYPKQTITMSNPFLTNAEKVREHSSQKTNLSKLQARYEPDE
jgi:hypothetical protein